MLFTRFLVVLITATPFRLTSADTDTRLPHLRSKNDISIYKPVELHPIYQKAEGYSDIENDEFPEIESFLTFEGHSDSDFYRLNIDYSADRYAFCDGWLKWLITSPVAIDSRGRIREVVVSGNYAFGNLSLISALFERMEGLEEVHWEYPSAIPEAILRSLDKNSPKCRLYHTFKSDDFHPERRLFPEGEDVTEHPFKRLINSKSLYSIQTEICYLKYNPEFDHMHYLFSVLSTAPNLRELDLTFSGVPSLSPFSFDFSSYPETRFAPLEILKLNGYSFDTSANGGDEWEGTYFGENGQQGGSQLREQRRADDKRSNLESWMDAMDWRHLHTLSIDWPSNATLSALRGSALPGLKNLEINNIWRPRVSEKDLLSFVTSTAQPLETISINEISSKTGDVLLSTLVGNISQTQNLKHFTFGADGRNLLPLNESRIATLLNTSLKLSSIDLNIHREANMSLDSTLVLAFLSSQTLEKITLRVSIPDQHFLEMVYEDLVDAGYPSYYMRAKNYEDWIMEGKRDAPPDPLFNHDTTLKLFKDMRERKSGKQLKEMVFYVGNWDDKHHREPNINSMVRIAHWRCVVEGLVEMCQDDQITVKEWEIE